MLDRVAPWALLLVLALVAVGYSLRAMTRGRVRYERVERQGASILLSRTVMEAGHWGAEPLARALIALGFSANALTLTSAVLGAASGASLAFGYFGIGAAIAMAAAVLDLLDGMVARTRGSASRGGKVLDSMLDRYVEFFFLAGVAIHVREDIWALVVTLAAIHGSFMVSYATAMAEIQKVEVSRGLMRRPERLVILLAGAVLTAALGALWPLLGSVGLVALGANATASLRLRELFLLLRHQ